jgi:hypothetical protein
VTLQPIITLAVRYIVGMLSAINLDDKAPATTDKVDRIRPDRLLPDEFEAVQRAIAEMIPNTVFGFG